MTDLWPEAELKRKRGCRLATPFLFYGRQSGDRILTRLEMPIQAFTALYPVSANGVAANAVFTWRRAFKRGGLAESAGDSRLCSRGEARRSAWRWIKPATTAWWPPTASCAPDA
jgi:hypothetical protein